MAERAIRVGTDKSRMPASSLFVLAILAGVFMALGVLFFVTIITGAEGIIPFGIVRLLSGLGFSLGTILIVVGGAELFTGNILMVMAWRSGSVRAAEVLRAWLIVYVGNAAGALFVAFVAFIAKDYLHSSGALGSAALSEAISKASLSPYQAFIHGAVGNVLICLAIWLTYSARSTTDKILAIVPPVTAFAAVGLEHSVANMFLLPFGALIRNYAPKEFLDAASIDPAGALNPVSIAINIGSVTLGNIVGGLAVGLAYWHIYHGKKR